MKQNIEEVRNMFNLKDQVDIVTGGAGALGSAMALGLAAYGANVVVTGRTLSTLESTVKQVAQEFKMGDVVNLGIGIPTQVANALPEGVKIILQSENGYMGVGPVPEAGKEDPDTVNAGGQYATILPGGCCFDSAMSFAIIRGGHVDATVLGALQVDVEEI